MKKTTYIITTGVIVAAALGGYAYSQKSAGQAADTHKMDTAMDHGSHSDAAVGISERVFIEHMIPHHQEAVDTAKQVLMRGENSEVKTLAQNIITAQEKEIADMKSWYEAWYGVSYTTSDTYTPMMRDLSPLKGAALDRAFVEDMIAHHTGALTTNQQVVPNIEHAELKALTASIAATQSSEIVTMRIILKQLPE